MGETLQLVVISVIHKNGIQRTGAGRQSWNPDCSIMLIFLIFLLFFLHFSGVYSNFRVVWGSFFFFLLRHEFRNCTSSIVSSFRTADRRHQIWQRAVQVGGGAGALLKYRYKFNCKYKGVNTLKLGQKYRICLLLTSSVHAKQRYQIWHRGA